MLLLWQYDIAFQNLLYIYYIFIVLSLLILRIRILILPPKLAQLRYYFQTINPLQRLLINLQVLIKHLSVNVLTNLLQLPVLSNNYIIEGYIYRRYQGRGPEILGRVIIQPHLRNNWENEVVLILDNQKTTFSLYNVHPSLLNEILQIHVVVYC